MAALRAVVAAAAAVAVRAYVCDLTNAAKPVPAGKFPTNGSPGQVLAAAAAYIAGPALASTEYSYTNYQDGLKMAFRNDCSCFLDYLCTFWLPNAYAAVPTDPTVQPPVPRARSWTNYLLSLGDEAAAAGAPWKLVPSLLQAQPGDVLAYALPPGASDTGHVMVVVNSTGFPAVSKAPNDDPSTYADAYWVSVVDSSTIEHQNDTRCPTCKFQSGVGSGQFKVYLDSAGKMAAFQFSEKASIHTAAGFALGRPLVR